MLRFVLTDKSKTAGLHFSNIRMYEDSTVMCVPDCLQIKKAVHRTFDKSYVAFDVMGKRYVAESTKDKVADGKRVQYCLVTENGIGRGGGASLQLLTKSPLRAQIRKGLTLPPCIYVEPHNGGYLVSLREDPRRQFLFSAKHNLGQVKDLMCVYPTVKPRCAEYSGVAKNRRSFKVSCVSIVAQPNCFETIYETRCGSEKYCGEQKQQQDMLTCCDKHVGKSGHASRTCVNNRRRRLGASAAALARGGDPVRNCADACMRTEGCVAYSVMEGARKWVSSRTIAGIGGCKLTKQCVTKPTKDTEELEWTVLPGVQKLDLFRTAGAALRMDDKGRIVIKRKKWSPSE